MGLFSLIKYPEAGLLDHLIILFSLRKLRTAGHSGFTSLHSINHARWFSFPHTYCLFDPSPSDLCDVHFPDYGRRAPLHVRVNHLYNFFRKMSVQTLCPSFNQCFCCWAVWFLFVLDRNPLSDMICNYFLPFNRLPSHLVDGFLLSLVE